MRTITGFRIAATIFELVNFISNRLDAYTCIEKLKVKVTNEAHKF